MLQELFLVYRQAPPSKSQSDAIYERVRHIPDQAMRSIMKNIEDNCDIIPRNLPKAIKTGWQQWREANPERIVHDRTECRACGGSGHMHVMKDELSYVFRCGHCENWRGESGEGVPVATVDQVMEAGFYFPDRPAVSADQIRKFYPKKLVEARLKKLGASPEPEPAYKEFDDRGNVYPFKNKRTA